MDNRKARLHGAKLRCIREWKSHIWTCSSKNLGKGKNRDTAKPEDSQVCRKFWRDLGRKERRLGKILFRYPP